MYSDSEEFHFSDAEEKSVLLNCLGVLKPTGNNKVA